MQRIAGWLYKTSGATNRESACEARRNALSGTIAGTRGRSRKKAWRENRRKQPSSLDAAISRRVASAEGGSNARLQEKTQELSTKRIKA